jgi:structural maintenance of chromosome 3 (chondroitin sulfate proteoglycan 6)
VLTGCLQLPSVREHWREDSKLDVVVNHAKDQLRTAERELGSMMDKDTGNGIRAIDRIVEKHGIRGVYGPLFRLLKVPEKHYNTVVELTAGNS